ncbi:E3 ubiquitin-protein ligase RNF5 [Geosmithia morbida]|uniref:E3 ubiquitin-protein ligase RNF5 n=1 Tax=Geosmithia morbida TaxID=1094350 RepID=A0A9P5D0V4_9HYPO|nr:E3 ubiquitin-protein ligase RNF5 [Geosmithia morbida]KAF4123138.1 E3 ubiquitin-protein ligase RNF5 [Geosmithia morbida]
MQSRRYSTTSTAVDTVDTLRLTPSDNYRHASSAAATAAAAAVASPPPPPREWPQDDITLPSLTFVTNADLDELFGEDDHFLRDLATNDYSSPSTYPSFTTAYTSADNSNYHRETEPSTSAAHGHHNNNDIPPPSHPVSLTSRPSASTSFDSFRIFNTGPDTATISQNIGDGLDDDVTMSPSAHVSNKRRRAPDGESSAKRGNFVNLDGDDDDDDNPFRVTPVRRQHGMTAAAGGGRGGTYMIDLTAPPAPQAPSARDEQQQEPENGSSSSSTKLTKLSAFQCAICMDDAASLTVTHCGHLYCAECLHSSLHVETTRGRCPMCRAKLDVKPRSQYTTKTKGFYPLELKLMTKTRKGKRKADNIT